MADVTQQEAEELADALINAAGALVMNASQMNQSRCADARHRVVEALTRPAPSPSDVEALFEELSDADAECNTLARQGYLHNDGSVVAARERYAKARCAIEARMRGAAVPEGWKLVPVEPTPEMVEYAFDAVGEIVTNSDGENEKICHPEDAYRAMVQKAAAPEVPRDPKKPEEV